MAALAVVAAAWALAAAKSTAGGPRLPLDVFLDPRRVAAFDDFRRHHLVHTQRPLRVLYTLGSESEHELEECEPWSVCSKVDLYDKWSPWLERQCRCPAGRTCPSQVTPADGHSIIDKTRQFKLCDPVKDLPRCRYFKDMTWTLSARGNSTSQTIHCHCPKGAVAYLIKRLPVRGDDGSVGYNYFFACSPQSQLRCARKEPCRLFTVRKRLELLDEVNTNTLCRCSHGHHCPKHHSDPGVMRGKAYLEENIHTFSGYCIPSSLPHHHA